MKDITEMTTKETIKDLPNRLFKLIWKMFSIKGLMMVGGFLLILFEVIDNWFEVVLYLFVSLFLVMGRELFKYIDKFKELK